MHPSLFKPIRFGAIAMPNRILMAPLTRARATRAFKPTPVMAEYYAQRAGAGLIISEATAVSRQGMGWPFAPGIWTDEQAEAWARVAHAVHGAGGRIMLQLWHMGRLVHPDFLGGGVPVAPSAIAASGHAHTYRGNQPRVTPRALGTDEIAGVVDEYRRATRRALQAGFDGVQIHAANGYLIDQFLHDGSNHRTDAYGGGIDNRCRFMLEVVQAAVEVAGADRVAVRLSPSGSMGDMEDSDVRGLFVRAAEMLDTLRLAFLELHEPGRESGFHPGVNDPVAPEIRRAYSGKLVLNSDYTPGGAQHAVEHAAADAISFGRPFISNPDLPERIAAGLPLADGDKSKWYTQGPEGYVDYPPARP